MEIVGTVVAGATLRECARQKGLHDMEDGDMEPEVDIDNVDDIPWACSLYNVSSLDEDDDYANDEWVRDDLKPKI